MDPNQRSSLDARFALHDAAQQGSIRAELRTLLVDAGLDDELVEDVLIVVSELSANATEHGGADAVTIGVTVEDGDLVTSVSYISAGQEEIPDSGEMPAPVAARGRGLAIVDALTDTCRHLSVDGSVSTICTFTLV